jgi:hypothetical protein
MHDTETRRTDPALAVVPSEVTDLQRALFGDGRPKGTLAQTIHNRAADTFEARPDDVRALRDFLLEWLGDLRPRRPDLTRLEVHGTITRANNQAGRMLKRAQVGLSTRMRVTNLVVGYMVWLQRSCDHRRAPEHGHVRECPDCKLVQVT